MRDSSWIHDGFEDELKMKYDELMCLFYFEPILHESMRL